MTRTVSDNFKKAVFAQETDIVFIVLLTISHPSFTEDVRLASDPNSLLPTAQVRGVVSRGQEYIYLPFSITLPVQDDSSISKANISIDNINRDIIAAVRGANSAVKVTIEIVLSTDLDTTEVSIDNFQLDTVTYDAFTVAGDISMEYYDLEPFPAGNFTPSLFPGMF